MDLFIRKLKEDNYFIVVDDAHRLVSYPKGEALLNKLSSNFEKIVLLSSQAPLNDFFNNLSA